MTRKQINASAKRHTRTGALQLLIAITLAGCSLPGISSRPSDPGPAYTQAAETIVAGLTQAAPALPSDTPTLPAALPTDTLVPTDTPSPAPTATPTLTATQMPTASSGRVIFEEDFEGKSSWYTEENNRFSLSYEEDGYVIRVDIRNAPVWSVRLQDYDDIRLEVDAARLDGPEEGYFGLVCRHVDEENFYLLLINSAGEAGIGKVQDGEFEFLTQGSAPSGAILGGDATNRIRADCIGDQLTLFANGQFLVEVEDEDYESGDVGLVVRTGSTPGLEVFFDNFVIIEPNV